MARQPSRPTWQLSVYLIKQTVRDLADVVDRSKSYLHMPARTDVLPNAQLYYTAPPTAQVRWQQFIQPAFEQTLNLRSRHSSALLVFRVRRRIFAVAFGYGRSLIANGVAEADFGLKTALNLCDPSTLSAVDFRTIQERTRIGKLQLSDVSTVEAFGLDTDTDLLRGIHAIPRDNSICRWMAAKWDCLSLATSDTVADLPRLARKLLRAYNSIEYQQHFPWIDHVRRVNDPGEIVQLDEELQRRFCNNTLNNIRLAMPELLDTLTATDARFLRADGPYFDSNVASYLNNTPRSNYQDIINTMKHTHKVYLVRHDTNDTLAKYPVYRCIVAEVSIDNTLYILADGEWFRLDQDFVDTIHRSVQQISPATLVCAPEWTSDMTEPSWNQLASDRMSNAFCLDGTSIPVGGGRSRVEPADIITPDRQLFHVKRKDKFSQGLSHLFAQGRVAAALIVEDREFRRQLADKLPVGPYDEIKSELTQSSFDASSWTIGYILLGANSTNPPMDIPFFSRVNLSRAAKEIRRMRYTVTVNGR